jgi:hypothetical protein
MEQEAYESRDAQVERIGGGYARERGVRAVVLGGSVAVDRGDARSDLDLYVYGDDELPVERRRAVARSQGAERLELDKRFFEPGDEWVDPSGTHVDVMFRTTRWIEAQLDRVLVRYEASVGYSTCFWANVLGSTVVVDRDGWFAGLARRAAQAYPEPLRRAVVAKNWPLLGDHLSSFRAQLVGAMARGDRVAASHRTAAWLASFFDVLFALNRQPHPGEKRLVALAMALCPARPGHLETEVATLIEAAARLDDAALTPLDRLADELRGLLEDAGLLAGERP